MKVDEVTMWTETEFEAGTSEFLKAACAEPARFVPIVGSNVVVGKISVASDSAMIKKLISEKCIIDVPGGFQVTDLGAKFA